MKKQSYNTILISVAGLILLLAVFPITVFTQAKQAPAASEEGKALYEDREISLGGSTKFVPQKVLNYPPIKISLTLSPTVCRAPRCPLGAKS